MQTPYKYQSGEILPSELTLPQTERAPFAPVTTRIMVMSDSFLELQLKEQAQAILDNKKQIKSLKADRAGLKHSLYVLNSLISRKLQLKKSLSIVLRENPEGFIAELSDINAWGNGEIEQEAIESLCRDLEDLYFCLKKEQKNLGKEMQKQWKLLKEFIKEKRK